MKLPVLISPLVAGRLLSIAFAVLGLGMTIALIIRSFEVASSDLPVKLELNTARPHQFPIIGQLNDIKRGRNDAKAGYEKGQKANLAPYDDVQKATSTTPGTNYPKGFQLISENRIHWLEYAEPSPWKRLALYYAGASGRTLSLLKVLYYGLGSWLLYRMLSDATATTPFTTANARRLRYLALLFLGLYLAQQLAYGLMRTIIPAFSSFELPQPLSHYVLLNTDNELPGIMVFYVLSVITVIYRRGVEMHQEAELTV